MQAFFVSDLHGQLDRYEKLFQLVAQEKPKLLFIGGDILPTALSSLPSLEHKHRDFVTDYLAIQFQELRAQLAQDMPEMRSVSVRSPGPGGCAACLWSPSGACSEG